MGKQQCLLMQRKDIECIKELRRGTHSKVATMIVSTVNHRLNDYVDYSTNALSVELISHIVTMNGWQKFRMQRLFL